MDALGTQSDIARDEAEALFEPSRSVGETIAPVAAIEEPSFSRWQMSDLTKFPGACLDRIGALPNQYV
jgi:hypothetical protein